MTKKEFIEVLEGNGHSYEIEGDKIVVTGMSVDLGSLDTLPPGVEFRNRGDAYLGSLKTIPPGVQFNNGRAVFLGSLETLPPGMEFNNGGVIYLNSLKTLPPGVQFKNGGDVYFESLIGGRINEWKGNIEGIDSKMLLNGMIKRGVFL